MSREALTTLLDLLGLLAIVVAVAGGLWALIGWWALGPAGVTLIAGSQLVAWIGSRGER